MTFLVPPDEQRQLAIEQLYFYKDPSTLDEDVDALIEWLSKQPHLPNIAGEYTPFLLYDGHRR